MTDYDSPFYITNDRTYIDQEAIDDGTAIVWPLSDDAKLRRSPERQYCGNYATYGDKGAAVYRHNADTHDLIAAGPNQHRDMVSSFPMVKTKAKAQARADRQLLDVQQQDVRITTRLVDIPASRVSLAKAGMRLQIKGTHWWPACDTWHYARIVTAQPSPHTDGSLYDIDLELVLGDESDGPPEPPIPPYEGDAFAGAQLSQGSFGDLFWQYDADTPTTGWYANPSMGPVAIIDDGGSVYRSIEASAAMEVRVSAEAGFAAVFSAGGFVRITCTSSVNGVIGTATVTYPGGGFGTTSPVLEIPSYDIVAGEILTFTGSFSGVLGGGGWGNGGVNGSFMRVGRGTHVWYAGGSIPAETWVGP